ncbi:MAG: thioredoxin-disulfide reductase [Christensenellaceae bacterium]|nr:thioredoxin-disulfide reductase [Christensenellaceae bacterium]
MYDVIIVGAGPAVLTAGIYAGRAGMSALILERVFPGGQIARAHIVENYPGFPDGVEGVELGIRFKEHAERHGAVIESAEVTGYSLDGEIKKVFTSDKTYEAKTVILAMGAAYKTLGLYSEKRFLGTGVSYCATCDGPFFRGKDVVVVGGGDTAIEDALYLANFVNRVYVVHRRDELRAQMALQKAARQNERIEFVWNSEVDTITGDTMVTGVRVRNNKTQEMRLIPCSGVFIAIGTVPHTEEVKSQVKTDAFGYIVTDSGMRTNLPGVFAAGDIVAKPLRQVVTAAADGAIAIYSAQEYLRTLEKE